MSGKEDVPEISPALFLDAAGQPMRFYVRPGPTKVQLRPWITNGGGTMCRNQEPGAILLIDPVEASSASVSTGQKYISSKYIKDCIERSQQLNVEDYVVSVGPSIQTRMATRHQGNGRLGYSPEDDAAILKFMENRQNEAKGNTVWKEMEKRHVTEHTWQSMRDRFLKHLQHKLVEKTLKKSPSKRKPLCFIESPLRKKKATSESETETVQKSTIESDSSETQISSEDSLCPTVSTNPPPSPERASSPPEASGEPSHASKKDILEESCVPVQEQETPVPETSKSCRLDEDRDVEEIANESSEHSSPKKRTSKTDPKSSRLDEDRDGLDITNESNGPSSPKKRSSKNSKSDSKSSTLDKDREGHDITNESNGPSSPKKTRRTTCKTSTSDSRSSRLDEDPDGQDFANEPNRPSSPKKTRERTSKSDSKSCRLDEVRDGQDIANASNEHSSPKKTTSKTDAKSSRLDEDRDEEDVTNESNEHSSPPKKRTCKTSKSCRLEEDRDGQNIANESNGPSTRERTCKTSKSVSKGSTLDEDRDGQDLANESNEHLSPNKTGQTTCKTSTSGSRSPRLDEDRFGQDIADGSNEHSTPNKTRQSATKTSTPDSRKLGILAKAAKEFEDSDMLDESEEGENPCEAPSIKPSDTHEGSASSATLAREPETETEHHEEAQPDSEDERPGPSSAVRPPSSIFHTSDSQEKVHSHVRGTPQGTRSRNLVEIKEHVMMLMSETKKDLVEVTKALLKASGDLKKAVVFLHEGHDHEKHGPLWTREDDEILLLADSCELEQLEDKYGEEEVTRRRAFLTPDGN